jgi:MHS family alpha-ketoglutarate permease-like MFS transporter
MFGGTAPVIYQAFKAADNVTAFIVYVTVIIAVSLVVYIFFLKNRAVTHLDREQGNAYEVLPSGSGRGR